jgi:UDP-N-acetylglucosamine pyrophosphorylase
MKNVIDPKVYIEKLDKQIEILSESFNNEEKSKQFKNEMKGFKEIFSNFIEGRTQPIIWEKIANSSTIPNYDSIPKVSDIKDITSKLAVIKLNGGLGTTM